MKKDLFLEEARLGPRDPALIRYDEAPHLRDLAVRFRSFALVDLAHAVMMVEEGILDRDRGAKLLGGLLDVLALGPGDFPWDPRSGSYLVQVEHYLARHVGDDVAGRLQTGRSRNDQDAAADRLFWRDLLLEISGDLVGLSRALLAQVRAHAGTIMPGYTHLQHAQPTTFGHYLARHASALERDLQRLEGAFSRTNLSALGGAAQAGTSWPLNRRRVAELLGHDGLVINSSDCGVFARDYVEENIACLSVMMSNVGRLATDLYTWHSWEFSFVEIADGLAATSSIMPQKKNPHALERTKALAGQAAGWLPATLACQRGVLSTDLDLYFGDDIAASAGAACVSALRLMTPAVHSLTVHADVMHEKAGAFWSTASNLADELVRRFDLPFRTAHQVVGRFVRASIQAGHHPKAASADLFRATAREVVGRDLPMEASALREALDPEHFLETRVTEGSVNPRRVLEHLALLDTEVARHAGRQSEKRAAARQATESLTHRARALAAR
ncbi:MAG: argininosuccinate lyase [bacterium]